MKSGHRRIVNLSTYSTVCDSTVDIRHFKNCVVQAVDTVIWLKLAVGCSKAIFLRIGTSATIGAHGTGSHGNPLEWPIHTME